VGEAPWTLLRQWLAVSKYILNLGMYTIYDVYLVLGVAGRGVDTVWFPSRCWQPGWRSPGDAGARARTCSRRS
jgi:hypothetical protein